MIRRMSLVAGLVVLLLFASGCRREDNTVPPVGPPEDRIIQTASLTDNPNEIRLTWDPVECETFLGVDVELEEEFVNLEIRVEVDVATCPPGGFSQTVVDIGEPLGDRRIFDLAFGDTVALTE